MAFRSRRFTGARRSFGRRPKRNGAWVGLAVMSNTIATATTSSWYLWDDLTSQRMNMGGKGVHQRTLLWVAAKASVDGSAPNLAWYLAKFGTDKDGNVPTALILPALPSLSTEMGIYEHDLMDYQFKKVFGSAGTGAWPSQLNELNLFFDIRAKRKLDDTDALLLTFTSLQAATIVSFVARTYVTW